MSQVTQRSLRMRYRYHDGDIVEITVSVWNGTFGGAANVYVEHEALSNAAGIIAGFPTSNNDHREVVLGAFGSEWAGGAVAL